MRYVSWIVSIYCGRDRKKDWLSIHNENLEEEDDITGTRDEMRAQFDGRGFKVHKTWTTGDGSGGSGGEVRLFQGREHGLDDESSSSAEHASNSDEEGPEIEMRPSVSAKLEEFNIDEPNASTRFQERFLVTGKNGLKIKPTAADELRRLVIAVGRADERIDGEVRVSSMLLKYVLTAGYDSVTDRKTNAWLYR